MSDLSSATWADNVTYKSFPEGVLDDQMEAKGIVQQCNCVTMKAAGLALRLSEKYEYCQPYAHRRRCPEHRTCTEVSLQSEPGTFSISRARNENHMPHQWNGRGDIIVNQDEPWIFNVFGQFEAGKVENITRLEWRGKLPERWGTTTETYELRLLWFGKCLNDMAHLGHPLPSPLAFPEFIGCDRAGGDWEKYLDLILDFAGRNPCIEVWVVNWQNASQDMRGGNPNAAQNRSSEGTQSQIASRLNPALPKFKAMPLRPYQTSWAAFAKGTAGAAGGKAPPPVLPLSTPKVKPAPPVRVAKPPPPVRATSTAVPSSWTSSTGQVFTTNDRVQNAEPDAEPDTEPPATRRRVELDSPYVVQRGTGSVPSGAQGCAYGKGSGSCTAFSVYGASPASCESWCCDQRMARASPRSVLATVLVGPHGDDEFDEKREPNTPERTQLGTASQ